MFVSVYVIFVFIFICMLNTDLGNKYMKYFWERSNFIQNVYLKLIHKRNKILNLSKFTVKCFQRTKHSSLQLNLKAARMYMFKHTRLVWLIWFCFGIPLLTGMQLLKELIYRQYYAISRCGNFKYCIMEY
jgi:hypothetical protein